MISPHHPAPRIFVSHSHKDNDFGIQLVRDLRRQLDDDDAVWYDAAGGLSGGDAWWRKIMEELRSRSTFLVILSPDALASPWVNNEIDLAWYQRTALGNKAIIPLLCRPCTVRDDLEMLQMISFLPPKNYEASFSELLAALGMPPHGRAASVPLAQMPPVPPALPISDAKTLVAAGPPHLPVPAFPGPMPESATPTLLLLSILEAFSPRYLPLTQRSVSIGRGPSNDVIVADPAVSHEHLNLSAREATWHVTRLPNAGLLYVNGLCCDDADLRAGDQITIGTSVLRFELPELDGPRDISDTSAVPRLAVNCPEYHCHFTVPLRGDAVTIGRAPESGIVVPSSVVSTHHAMLRRESTGDYAIEDTGSLNGMTLHGKRIQRERLRDGDVLIIGSRSQQQFVTLTYTKP